MFSEATHRALETLFSLALLIAFLFVVVASIGCAVEEAIATTKPTIIITPIPSNSDSNSLQFKPTAPLVEVPVNRAADPPPAVFFTDAEVSEYLEEQGAKNTDAASYPIGTEIETVRGVMKKSAKDRWDWHPKTAWPAFATDKDVAWMLRPDGSLSTVAPGLDNGVTLEVEAGMLCEKIAPNKWAVSYAPPKLPCGGIISRRFGQLLFRDMYNPNKAAVKLDVGTYRACTCGDVCTCKDCPVDCTTVAANDCPGGVCRIQRSVIAKSSPVQARGDCAASGGSLGKVRQRARAAGGKVLGGVKAVGRFVLRPLRR